MASALDFEKPIIELEKRIEELQKISEGGPESVRREIEDLESQLEVIKNKIYRDLTPWQRVQIARHPERPQTKNYVDEIFTDWLEFSGDRLFFDDHSVLTGFSAIDEKKFVVVGTQKGITTRERMARNFGMPNPEGYRKALRAFRLAEKFELPLVTLIDTSGANPGLGAEERGQAWAISENLKTLASLKTPVISIVIGEAASGGALAICVGDRLAMLENSYYSVITPEGCATILWNDASKAPEAAEILKLTAKDALDLTVINEIIGEPPGGAHKDPSLVFDAVREFIVESVNKLCSIPLDELVGLRYERLRRIGVFEEREA